MILLKSSATIGLLPAIYAQKRVAANGPLRLGLFPFACCLLPTAHGRLCFRQSRGLVLVQRRIDQALDHQLPDAVFVVGKRLFQFRQRFRAVRRMGCLTR